MDMQDLRTVYETSPSLPTLYDGEAGTGARLPYTVSRPLYLDDTDLAVSGDSVAWDQQFTLYACGGSVEASFNSAMSIISHLQGQYVAGCTLACSMGYSGAQVEGHYESQITVQINQGGL